MYAACLSRMALAVAGVAHLRPEGGQLFLGGSEQPSLWIENLETARRILERGPVLKRSSGSRRRVSNRDHQRVVDRQDLYRRLRCWRRFGGRLLGVGGRLLSERCVTPIPGQSKRDAGQCNQDKIANCRQFQCTPFAVINDMWSLPFGRGVAAYCTSSACSTAVTNCPKTQPGWP